MTARFELIEDPVLISLLKEHVSPPHSSSALFHKVFGSTSHPPNLYRVILETKNPPRREIIWVKHNGEVMA